jgi:prepilin-type processing-associated H-X9-DG protein
MTADDWLATCARGGDDMAYRGERRCPSGRTWLTDGALCTAFFTAAPPNSPIPDCGVLTGRGEGNFAARSYHPGGVNAALADGSVRWFASSIATPVWRALGTRASGEIVSPGP